METTDVSPAPPATSALVALLRPAVATNFQQSETRHAAVCPPRHRQPGILTSTSRSSARRTPLSSPTRQPVLPALIQRAAQPMARPATALTPSSPQRATQRARQRTLAMWPRARRSQERRAETARSKRITHALPAPSAIGATCLRTLNTPARQEPTRRRARATARIFPLVRRSTQGQATRRIVMATSTSIRHPAHVLAARAVSSVTQRLVNRVHARLHIG